MRIGKNKYFLISVMCLLILTLFLLFKLEKGISNVKVDKEDPAQSYLSPESIKYPTTLFEDTYVHFIQIQVDEKAWSSMIKNAQSEQYIPCTMIIDGIKMEEVGIRPKGNSSLKQISGMGSENFSFKVEFDHYKSQTFQGLDKMALNNCTQDTTYMKDYITHNMMRYMGVAAPLSSFVNITLNGKDFGFYLAVEAIEESFCLRNYGNTTGKLYKPDSLSLSNFNFAGVMNYKMENGDSATKYLSNIMSGDFYKGLDHNTRADVLGDIVNVILGASNISTDVSGLVYIDDDPLSYKTIFDTSVFKTTEQDKKRLINSIKKLNMGEDINNTIDIESIIKYFVVHNFVDNYDGYTSIFSHNYYLYENEGKLSMIPWDYNLAFGVLNIDAANSANDLFSDYILTVEKNYGMSSDKSMVNYPIDTPVFTIDMKDRPMIYQILNNKDYHKLYHEYFNDFISEYFESGYFEKFYSKTVEMISPWVKSDAKLFYTYEQFEDGVRELEKFCNLRVKSVKGQLDGTIPSTLDGQKEEPQSLIDTGDLDMMKTLDFTTIIHVMGISTEDINEILKAVVKVVPDKYITEGKIDTSKLTIDDIENIKNNIGVIAPIAFQLVKGNNALKQSVIKVTTPWLIIILSLLAMLIFTVLISKYSRIKYKNNCKRGNRFEAKARIQDIS